MSGSMSFFIFIFVVILIYSLLNYYFIRKNKNILTGKSLPVILVRLVLFTLIAAPVATIFFSYKGMTLWASITGFTGYSWLAFLFLFLMIHGFADIILFVAEKAGFIPSGYMARVLLIITLSLSMAILGYGFYEADNIQVQRLQIKTSKIPHNVRNVRIMQLSDIHFSPMIGAQKARKIKSLVEKEKPDILVSTGDFLDRAIRDSDEVSSIMRTIEVPMGKYAITGNHEYISGVDRGVVFINKSGFKILRNNTVTLRGLINLAGVDDLSAVRFGQKPLITEKDILPGLDHSLYTVLLKHQPRIETEAVKYFDLQLSGHTHGGQIFPFTLLVKSFFPCICGKYELDAHTILYVSRGTGTWGPPIRVLALPEVTVIDIMPL